MPARLAWLLVVVALTACWRGAPEPEPSATAAAPAPATEATAAPTEAPPTEAATEAPTEAAIDTSVGLGALLVIPGTSGDPDWVQIGDVRRRRSFAEWLEQRGVGGEAQAAAAALDEQYGFRAEAEVRYAHRRAAGNDVVRTRQLLVSRFRRADSGLSQAWCSVDDDTTAAVQLDDSQEVADAVAVLEGLPGSCGAVRDAGPVQGYRADISFRHGPFMIQVAAIEPEPVAALEAIARAAPAVHRRIVDATSPETPPASEAAPSTPAP